VTDRRTVNFETFALLTLLICLRVFLKNRGDRKLRSEYVATTRIAGLQVAATMAFGLLHFPQDSPYLGNIALPCKGTFVL
jgi:hypothetical protein